jgi:hypothetical protein
MRFSLAKTWIKESMATPETPDILGVRQELLKYTDFPVPVIDAWISEIMKLPIRSGQHYNLNGMIIHRIS